MLALPRRDMFSVVEQPGLDLYPVYLYRNLGDAEVEDEGNAQERGFGGRKMDLGWQLEVEQGYEFLVAQC